MPNSQHCSDDGPRVEGKFAVALAAAVALIVVAVVLLRGSGQPEASELERRPSAIEAEPVLLPPTLLPEVEAAPVTAMSAEPTSSPQESSVPGDARAVDVVLDDREAQYAVLVVDSSERPVPGAEVAIRYDRKGFSPEFFARLRVLAENAGGRPDEEGFKLLQAKVEAERRRLDDELAPETQLTDAEGRCRFARRGALKVQALKEGLGTSGEWSSHSYEAVKRGDTDRTDLVRQVRLRLQRQGTIEGRVVDSQGESVAGAEVVAESGYGNGEIEPRAPAPVTTDDNGEFLFDVDAPFDFELHARVGDDSTTDESVTSSPGQTRDVVLHVKGAYGVRGRVVDESGKPVAGANLTLSNTDGPGLEFTDSGADGRFDFPLAAPGEFELVVTAEGLSMSESHKPALTAEKRKVDLVVRMGVGGSISGVVRWDDGEPIESAHVNARTTDPALRASSSSSMALSDSTGHDGAFRIHSLDPRKHYDIDAFVVEPALARTMVSDIAVGAGDVEVVISRQAARGFTLTGRVVDARTGNPIRSYELAHGMWIRGLYDGKPTAIEDEGGRFRLTGINWHERALEVRAEGYPPKTVGPIDLVEPPQDMLIELERAGGLVVRTVDESGEPVSDARVFAILALSEGRPDLYNDKHEARSSAEGKADFGSLPAARCALQAQRGELLSDLEFTTISSDAPTTATIVLRTSLGRGRLVVTVHNRAGQPVVNSEVAVTNMSKLGLGEGPGAGVPEAVQRSTSASGRAEFDGLLPGHYWVWPQVDGEFISPEWVAVSAERTVEVQLSP